MGKKNRKKEDDEDYFASLAAPVSEPLEEDEALEEERFLKAEAARERASQKKAQDEADKRERAASAARAKIAMEKRMRQKKGEHLPEEEEEEEEESEALTEEAPPPVVLQKKEESSLVEKMLVALRRHMSGFFLIAIIARLLYFVLSFFASTSTLDVVEAAPALEKADIEKTDPPASVRFRENKWERRIKNLKTKSKEDTWTKIKDFEGFATAPACLETSIVPESEIRFFALFDDSLCDCTNYISTQLVTPIAAKDIDIIDSQRPLFLVEKIQDSWRATLHPKAEAEFHKKHDNIEHHNMKATTKDTKNKLSRADKKAKKLQYAGRR